MTHVHKRLKPHPHGAGKVAEHCLVVWPPEQVGRIVHMVKRVRLAVDVPDWRERLLQRHHETIRLWQKGERLREIAVTLGYADPSGPWHHINAKCRCMA